ncbi:MAG: prepilin peptidase [Candidatus Dormibacteria bacterium]
MDLRPFFTGYALLMGLVIGSFINLAADRIPRGESVVQPRSFCRGCGRHLGVVDLLPVAGYLLRRGRCATCAAPIGASSPLIEAGAGILLLLSVLLLGPLGGGLLGLLFEVVLGMVVVAVGRRGA